MAKKAKRRVDLDRISNLPDEIVCSIISFLSFKQAVCTSILSKRWRYLYASMSTFDFDFDFDDAIVKHSDGAIVSKANHLAHSVNRLMYHTDTMPTLECFRIINLHDRYVDPLHFYGWISAALWRGVKELDLQLRARDRVFPRDRDFLRLPTSLYTSISLVTLKLNMSHHVLKVPTNVCFPNLKALHLRYLAFSDKALDLRYVAFGDEDNSTSIGRLLENCPVLEDLVIKECANCDMNHVGLHIFKSLVTLKLNLTKQWHLKVPANFCFPNLKTLHLRNCIILSDNDSIWRLFSSCIVLEDLVIKQCSMRITELHISNPSLKRLKLSNLPSHSMVINAPSLVYFNYVDYIANGFSIGNMPSLVQADISLYKWPFSEEYKCAANQLLQAIGNVKSLRLTIQEQSNEILDECCRKPKLVFHGLVMLEVAEESDNNYKRWQGTWLVEFLRCTPNITSLLISLEFDRVGDWSPPDKVPDCLSKLKEIKMLKFDGHRRLLNMITYFLMNANDLEKLTLCMNGLKQGERLSIANKVMKISRRSSDKCQVLFE